MKNDEHEVNQQPQRSDIENSGAGAKPPTNNNGQETSESGHNLAAEASGKRTVSSRKVEANRSNARKSTGPRTAAGKKRVSENATKHGFYSKHLLVQHPDGGESRDEYDDFEADVVEYFQPVGWLEKNWVEKIAVWSWRLRRIIRSESGQIARALAEHSYDLQQSRWANAEESGSISAIIPEMAAMTDHLFFTSEGREIQLRLEAMINRELNHAFAELERLQAARGQKSAWVGITKQSQEVV